MRTSASLLLAREPAEAEELAGEPPQVAVVRLRQVSMLGRRRASRRTRAAGCRGRRGGAAAGSVDDSMRPASGTRTARAAPPPPPMRSSGRASATARSAEAMRPASSSARGAAGRPAARRSCRARTEKSCGSICASAASRGNSFTQASLAAKRAARLAARPGPSPASANSCAVKKRESPRPAFSRSSRSMRAISTEVDAAALGARQGSSWARAGLRAVRRLRRTQQHGALVPAKPRHSTSATGAARHLRATPTPRARRNAGSSSRSVAMPGTTFALSAASADHGFDDAGGGDQMAERPLEPGHRRHRVAEHAQQRRRFRAVGLRRAVARARRPCRRRRARSRASSSAWRIARSGPSPSARMREQALGLRARSRRPAPRPAPARRARAPTPRSRAPARPRLRRTGCRRARVERPQRLGGEQPDAVVVEHHLRLDRRLVAHRDYAIGFAVRAAPPCASITASRPPTL